MSKKILILSMTCNVERFKNEEQAIKETWGKTLKEKYPNMSLYFYKGDNKSNILDFDTHEINLTCGDGLKDTYKKTIEVFKVVRQLDFDYLIRTNTSTYLNLEIIDKLVDMLDGEKRLYGGRLISNPKSEYVPFFRGDFLMMPKSLMEEIIDIYPKYNLSGPDDICIARTLYNERKNDEGLKEYIKLLREVEGMEKITVEDYFKKISSAVYIRIKENKNGENHVEILKTLHKLIEDFQFKFVAREPHIITKVETIRGITELNFE